MFLFSYWTNCISAEKGKRKAKFWFNWETQLTLLNIETKTSLATIFDTKRNLLFIHFICPKRKTDAQGLNFKGILIS